MSQKNKKQRVELTSPINPLLLAKDSVKALRKSHDISDPYRHIVLKDVCTDERMRKIHEEITNNMKANFKETDLFKVFQTGDLATLDSAQQSAMPHLLSLRQHIYSPDFRQFVMDITGCGELTDRVDCSCNAYAHGCHLLCHDDVIGTRRISYIIYLTDPDEPWTASDGGAVELYPLIESSAVSADGKNGKDKQGIPTSVPTKCLLPTFNTMLMFAVQPGKSYHSVQEVFNAEKPRLSISGWYHATTPPVGSDMSSLKQIMTLGDDHRAFTTFPAPDATKTEKANNTPSSEDEVEKLSKKELKQLAEWVNPNYLAPAALQDIREQFCANSSLQLNNFIRTDLAYKLTQAMIVADETQNVGHGKPQLDYTVGTSDAWQLVGPPHKRRHLVYSEGAAASTTPGITHSDAVGAQLDAIRRKLFRSAVFAKYLRIVTALDPVGFKDEVRRFRSGLDYTVAHYGVLTKTARLDATLCFVNEDLELQERIMGEHNGTTVPATSEKKVAEATKASKNGSIADSEEEEEEEDYVESFEEVWDGGEVGGFECYIEAEEDPENAEAAEVYRSSYQANPSKPTEPGAKAADSKSAKDKAEDAETSLLSVSAVNNTLSLVMRDEGVMKFIKYVSANAPGSRWDIAVEYEITPPEEGSESSSSEGDEDEDSEEGSEEEGGSEEE